MSQALGKYIVYIIFQQIREMWLYFTKKRNWSIVRLDTMLIHVQTIGASISARLTVYSQCLQWLNTAVTTVPQRLSEIKKAHQLQHLLSSALVFTNSNSSTFQRCWFSLLQHITQGLVKGISFGFSQTIGLDRQFLCDNCIPTSVYIYDF